VANLTRIQMAIDIMQNVADNHPRNFNLGSWQTGIQWLGRLAKTPEEVVSCGSACCFSGWMALTPEVKAIKGVGMHLNGAMMYKGKRETTSIAKFLGITKDEAEQLIFPQNYPCRYDKITPEDVICRLEKLKDKYSVPWVLRCLRR
jgi:predicted alpha/beta hydrolase